MSTQLNKIHTVKTIALVARELARDVEWLGYIADGMEPEDGLIWVRGIGEDLLMAFSEEGVETLENLMAVYRQLG